MKNGIITVAVLGFILQVPVVFYNNEEKRKPCNT